MGNCIDLLCSQPWEKIRVLIFNGGGKEFEASTPVKKITTGPYQGYELVHHAQPRSSLPLDTELIHGDVYFLVPRPLQPSSPLVSHELVDNNSGGGRSVKIVVSRHQLEWLLRNAKELPHKNMLSDMRRVLG